MFLSPLEQFSIIKLINLKIFFFPDISFTNSSLIMFIVLFIFFSIFKLSYSKTIIPNKWQNFLEIYYIQIHNLVKDNIGNLGFIFFPFIFGLFTYIVLLNLLGMIPYNLTVTSHIIVTFSMSLSIWLAVTLLSLKLHKLNFFSTFMPSGAPIILAPLLVLIELLSYCAKAISLGVRLAANMTAGHILLAIMSGFAWTMLHSLNILTIASIGPLLVLLFIIILELAVAIIQAFVFTLLTTIFLNDAIHLH